MPLAARVRARGDDLLRLRVAQKRYVFVSHSAAAASGLAGLLASYRTCCNTCGRLLAAVRSLGIAACGKRKICAL